MGDFNLVPYSTPVASLVATNQWTCADSELEIADPTRKKEWNGNPRHVDYAIHTPQLRVLSREMVEVDWSDHHLVIYTVDAEEMDKGKMFASKRTLEARQISDAEWYEAYTGIAEQFWNHATNRRTEQAWALLSSTLEELLAKPVLEGGECRIKRPRHEFEEPKERPKSHQNSDFTKSPTLARLFGLRRRRLELNNISDGECRAYGLGRCSYAESLRICRNNYNRQLRNLSAKFADLHEVSGISLDHDIAVIDKIIE